MIQTLLKHEDVRVRVAAAYAFGKLAKADPIAIAVLKEGVAQPAVPMPMGFDYPSRAGPAHHRYTAAALADLRQQSD